jgi:glycosyltransferase involved in cell wall biosynthesis
LSKAVSLISFIIPALNEASNIGATIFSIRSELHDVPHEVIVVDNGSSDATVSIAERMADITIVDYDSTVAGLRNAGAGQSSGDVMVFNDADVLLAKGWLEEFKEVKNRLLRDKIILGGSLESPDQGNLLYSSWFGPMLSAKSESSVSYVGTGHLLVSRDLFFQVGGFDEELISGEDVDFCRKAVENNASILFDANLRALHVGYPSSLRDFFKRELWHGSGDYQSIDSFFQSKTAMYSCAMLGIHSLFLMLSIVYSYHFLTFLGLSLVIFPVIFSFSKYQCRLGFRLRACNIFYSYIYLLARSFCCLRMRNGKRAAKMSDGSADYT